MSEVLLSFQRSHFLQHLSGQCLRHPPHPHLYTLHLHGPLRYGLCHTMNVTIHGVVHNQCLHDLSPISFSIWILKLLEGHLWFPHLPNLHSTLYRGLTSGRVTTASHCAV